MQQRSAWAVTVADGRPLLRTGVKLKGSEPAWGSPTELPTLPPMPWANCKGAPTDPGYRASCTGNVTVAEQGGTVLLSSSTGRMAMAAGQQLSFHADLVITPAKPVDLKRHATTRYVHLFGQVPVLSTARLNQTTLSAVVDEFVALGANWAILHQGTTLNPWIDCKAERYGSAFCLNPLRAQCCCPQTQSART